MQLSTADNSRIKNLLISFGVKKAGIFGSQTRQETHSGSDLDLLVELQQGASLFDMIRLKHLLEDELHISVDLVEYDALKPIIRNTILQEEIRLI